MNIERYVLVNKDGTEPYSDWYEIYAIALAEGQRRGLGVLSMTFEYADSELVFEPPAWREGES